MSIPPLSLSCPPWVNSGSVFMAVWPTSVSVHSQVDTSWFKEPCSFIFAQDQELKTLFFQFQSQVTWWGSWLMKVRCKLEADLLSVLWWLIWTRDVLLTQSFKHFSGIFIFQYAKTASQLLFTNVSVLFWGSVSNIQITNYEFKFKFDQIKVKEAAKVRLSDDQNITNT